MTPAELAQAWRARAEELKRNGYRDIAIGYCSCAADLEAGFLDLAVEDATADAPPTEGGTDAPE